MFFIAELQSPLTDVELLIFESALSFYLSLGFQYVCQCFKSVRTDHTDPNRFAFGDQITFTDYCTMYDQMMPQSLVN